MTYGIALPIRFGYIWSMETLLTIVHVISCVLLVLLVLVQQGKGSEVAATFGGSSQTIFGSSGGANFFQILTSIFAALFMITSIWLTWQSSQSVGDSIMDTAPPPVSESAPANPAKAPVPQADAKSDTEGSSAEK